MQHKIHLFSSYAWEKKVGGLECDENENTPITKNNYNNEPTTNDKWSRDKISLLGREGKTERERERENNQIVSHFFALFFPYTKIGSLIFERKREKWSFTFLVYLSNKPECVQEEEKKRWWWWWFISYLVKFEKCYYYGI